MPVVTAAIFLLDSVLNFTRRPYGDIHNRAPAFAFLERRLIDSTKAPDFCGALAFICVQTGSAALRRARRFKFRIFFGANCFNCFLAHANPQQKNSF
ncbi:hypothetical protein AVI53_17120 (plasmid) [Piscirickettsia salmonis]|nr:hypothetical protein AVI53_17120 [Piscirickettsia salmonis]